MVEQVGLENRCTGNRTVGSNPTLSAKTALKPADFRHSEKVSYKRTYKCVWSGRSGPRHWATNFLCGDHSRGTRRDRGPLAAPPTPARHPRRVYGFRP